MEIERTYSMMITKQPEWNSSPYGVRSIKVTDLHTGTLTIYASIKDTAIALNVVTEAVQSSLRQRYNIKRRYRCEYEA
jgi:hypothetical protein